MAIQLQIRRGTTAENGVFTGAVGELTMDADTNGLRIHDGNTVGGVQIPTSTTADYVVESQEPTSANNYTWYRKYKSGWIEQGGRCPNGTSTGQINLTGTFPVPMNARWMNASPIYVSGQSVVVVAVFSSTTTITVTLEKNNHSNTTSTTASAWWVASGYVI